MGRLPVPRDPAFKKEANGNLRGTLLGIFKRRRFYVHPIQKRYAFLAATLLITYTFLIILFLLLPPAIKLISGQSLEEKAQAAMQYIILGERIWPAITISISILAIISFYITHKLAGPIYRFEKTAKDVIDGDLSLRIRLRKKDDLKELANLFNRLLEKLDNSLREIRKREIEIGADLPLIIKGLDSTPEKKQEILEGLQAIIEKNREIRDMLERFKLSDQDE